MKGVVVLDLSRYFPGPLACTILGQMGARVIKVEQPGTGDPLREWEKEQGSPFFQVLNSGKEGVFLDLATPSGRARLLSLVGSSDILVESYRPEAAAQLGITYSELARVNPRLILCSIVGYPRGADREGAAAHDLNFAAEAGMWVDPGGGATPCPPPTQVVDLTASLLAVIAVMAALNRRQETGVGSWVEVSLQGAASMGMLLAGIAAFADVTLPLTGELPCYRYYRTADDGWIAVAALEQKFWVRFCTALGDEELATRNHLDRGDQELCARVAALVAQRTALEWRKVFAKVDCCAVVAGSVSAAGAVPLPARTMAGDTLFSPVAGAAPLLPG